MKFRIPRFLFLTGAVYLHSLLVTAQSFKPQSIRVAPLMERASQHKGVLVINFWSTWCKPCIQEIPHFLTVAAADTAVQLWLVSQDTKTLYSSGKLQAYLTANKWKARHFWLNEADADYYCPLVDETWTGVIPATLIVAHGGRYKAFYEQELSAQELELAIAKAKQDLINK